MAPIANGQYYLVHAKTGMYAAGHWELSGHPLLIQKTSDTGKQAKTVVRAVPLVFLSSTISLHSPN